MKELVSRLSELKKTIATMESCTGGGIVNAITNIEGASDVLKYSAVTYANEYKIKMGVSKDIIDKYSVYSMETACEMSRNISLFADSDFGVGVTGKLGRVDKNNLIGNDNTVYISVYDKNVNKYYNATVIVDRESREENKRMIIDKVEEMIMMIIS